MGLFDFVINQGKKLFGAGDDPAAKIKQEIEADNPGVKNLNVEFKDGQVSLSGQADSAEAMEAGTEITSAQGQPISSSARPR